jgi:hypothetical protein
MLNWLRRLRMPLVKFEPLPDAPTLEWAQSQVRDGKMSINAARDMIGSTVPSGILQIEGRLTIEVSDAIRAAWKSGWRPTPGKWERIPC